VEPGDQGGGRRFLPVAADHGVARNRRRLRAGDRGALRDGAAAFLRLSSRGRDRPDGEPVPPGPRSRTRVSAPQTDGAVCERSHGKAAGYAQAAHKRYRWLRSSTDRSETWLTTARAPRFNTALRRVISCGACQLFSWPLKHPPPQASFATPDSHFDLVHCRPHGPRSHVLDGDRASR
jgi:hypothetical protein